MCSLFGLTYTLASAWQQVRACLMKWTTLPLVMHIAFDASKIASLKAPTWLCGMTVAIRPPHQTPQPWLLLGNVPACNVRHYECCTARPLCSLRTPGMARRHLASKKCQEVSVQIQAHILAPSFCSIMNRKGQSSISCTAKATAQAEDCTL